MGNWTITIKGLGCHHNNNAEKDANLASQQFVSDLIEKQHHTIVEATFDTGSQKDDLFVDALKANGNSEDVIAAILKDAAVIRNTYWPEPPK